MMQIWFIAKCLTDIALIKMKSKRQKGKKTMNDDLISRQAVTDLIIENDPWWCEGMTRTIFDGINRLPSVDAVPVKHGKWIQVGHIEHMQIVYKCSACNGQTIVDGNFCPNCGARMDADAE
jgi:hypothetical protein